MKRTSIRLYSPILVLVLTAGCGVSFSFGGAPAVAPTSNPVQQCVAAKRIVTRPAHAEFATRQDVGGNIVVVTTHHGNGLTFYRGQTRLTAEQALRILGDENLRLAYTGLYRKRLNKGRTGVTAGGWLMGGGIAAGAIGTGMLFAGAKAQADKTMYAGIGIALGGALVFVVSYWVLRYGIRHRNYGEALQTVFLSPRLQPSLQRAIQWYNRRGATRCGAPVVAPKPKPRPQTLPRPRTTTQPPPTTVPPPAP